MLTEVIVPAEFLAAAWVGAGVRFFVGVNTPYVPLQMLTTSEAFTAALDIAQIHSSALCSASIGATGFAT